MRLRHIIVLLIIGILGLQSGAMAMAMHTQRLPAATAPLQVGHNEHGASQARHAAGHHHQRTGTHDAHQTPAQADAGATTNRHGPGCASAQSCCPIGHTPTVAVTAPLLPMMPAASPPTATPSSRPERLLRPPRLHA